MSKLMEILKDIRPENDFESSTNFLEDNYLDSLDIVTLLTEIEDICGIEIEYADITEHDFETEATILRLVTRSGGNPELLNDEIGNSIRTEKTNLSATTISIIVPVYNVEKYVSECLDSILNQTYEDIEVIVIDDGSTDNSGRICDEYQEKDSRIKVFHQENKGLSAAKNAGIENASGKYLMFIDSDDTITTDMCEKLMNAAINNDVDMVLCNVLYVNEENQTLTDVPDSYKKLNDCTMTGREFIKSLCDNYNVAFVISCNKLYKNEILRDFRFIEGLFEEDEAGIHHIAHKCKKIVFVSDVCYLYRQRNGSIMNRQHNLKKLDNTLGLLDRLEFIKKHNYEEETIYRLENEIIHDFIRSVRSLDRKSRTHISEIKRFHKMLIPVATHLYDWKELTAREKYTLKIFKISPLIFFYWN